MTRRQHPETGLARLKGFFCEYQGVFLLFWEHQDRNLLLGSDVPPHLFSDTNLSRSLDAIFEAGSSRIVTELVGIAAAGAFGLDVRAVSYDTTSTSCER